MQNSNNPHPPASFNYTIPFPLLACDNLLFIVLFFPLPKGICQSTPDQIRKAEPHGCSPHKPSCTEFLHEWLFPTSCQQQIQARPGSRQPSTIDNEALEVGVAGEQKHGREDHGKRLERTHMLSSNGRSRQCWGEWVFYIQLDPACLIYIYITS